MADATGLLSDGVAAQRAGRYGAAAAAFRAALAADPGLVEARGRLGDLLVLLDWQDGPPPPSGADWEAFDVAFGDLLASDIAGASAIAESCPADSLQGLLLRARVARRCLDHDAVVALTRAAVLVRPGSPNARQMLAEALIRQDAVEEAGALLADLVDRDHLVSLQVQRALCLHRAGRAAAAVAAFRAAAPFGRQRPVKMIPVYYGLMQAFRDADDLERSAGAAGRLQACLQTVDNGLLHLVRFLRGWEAPMRAAETKRALTTALRRAATAGLPTGFYPETRLLPEERPRLADEAPGVWIVKPESFSGGQGIWLTDRAERVPADLQGVLQRYVRDPVLVNGLKGHLRLYLLVTATAPLRVWMWRDGIVRFAPRPFAEGEGWLDRADMHVTNTALHLGNPLLRVGDRAEAESEGHIWSLEAFIAALPTDATGRGRFRSALRALGEDLIAALQAGEGFALPRAGALHSYPPKLLGLDVVVDSALKPWLVEAQFGPALSGNALVRRLNSRLLRAIGGMTLAPALSRATSAEAADDAEAAVADRFERLAVS